MRDFTHWLLLIGTVGWLLLAILLQVGRKSVFWAFVRTLFASIILMDVWSVSWGIIAQVLRKGTIANSGSGRLLVFSFIILPYLLSGVRLYWLSRRVPEQKKREAVVDQGC
jgi:hypothetical protein